MAWLKCFFLYMVDFWVAFILSVCLCPMCYAIRSARLMTNYYIIQHTLHLVNTLHLNLIPLIIWRQTLYQIVITINNSSVPLKFLPKYEDLFTPVGFPRCRLFDEDMRGQGKFLWMRCNYGQSQLVCRSVNGLVGNRDAATSNNPREG